MTLINDSSTSKTNNNFLKENGFEIVVQERSFVVINKAAGINFHDESELGEGLFNKVKSQLVEGGLTTSLFPVHRLDKMTSGLLIFATDLTTAQTFQKLFSSHEIEKYYLAISENKPKKKQGLIKGDMEKSRRGTWKLLRTIINPAITQFFSYPIEQSKRLYLLKPHSGKTHQIRVAMNSIGSPILGDQRYNSASSSDRGYLHAYALRFTLNDITYQYILPPKQGESFTQESTAKPLAKLTLPWDLVWPKVK